jgi:hypothetical protein
MGSLFVSTAPAAVVQQDFKGFKGSLFQRTFAASLAMVWYRAFQAGTIPADAANAAQMMQSEQM